MEEKLGRDRWIDGRTQIASYKNKEFYLFGFVFLHVSWKMTDFGSVRCGSCLTWMCGNVCATCSVRYRAVVITCTIYGVFKGPERNIRHCFTGLLSPPPPCASSFGASAGLCITARYMYVPLFAVTGHDEDDADKNES